ncbi:MAG TPA: ABC transporter ATP-binding protein [Gaiellaceae bacterium]|nr:ABC transporter ATP-binding protein [Gaiellaceae bacterium]
MSCSMLRLEGVTKCFDDVVAVEEASLCVDRGEVVAILGPSGCGKTTLLRLLAGFERPDAGTVEIDGRRVAGAEAWVPPEMRRIGMVFQDYALFPHLTVAENVGFGLPRRMRPGRVAELLGVVDLSGLGGRYPHELSGGQQQRVAVARALAPAPYVLLLDEPWSNVDPFLRESLRSEVSEIIRPLGITVVLVTHDRGEAFSLADRIALMRDGKIVQEGTSEELYFAPASRWAAEFVGAGNVLTGPVTDGFVQTALGAFPANGSSVSQVLIRPELLELRTDPAGDAMVVAREFRGHDVFYRVRLNGTELVSQRPSTEIVPLGARVSIRLHDGRVPILS